MKCCLIFCLTVFATTALFFGCQQKATNENNTTSAGTGTAAATATDEGERLYTMYCVRCHQASGIGGPTPTSGIVPGQGVQAKDIRASTKSEAELIAFISNGWGQMPSFKDSTSDGNIALIAHYVATKIERKPGSTSATR